MNPLANAASAKPLLGVNIDHVATLRNARGGGFPDPVRAAHQAVQAGADIITFHLREDRRHIRDADVVRLKAEIAAPLNFESAVTAEMLDIICRVRPQMVCLVPERRQEITTEGGLDVAGQFDRVRAACARLADCGCRVSLFIEPSAPQIEAAARTGAPCIELHTGAYANAVDAGDEAARTREFARITAGLELGRSLGLQTNAGHGLSLTSTAAIAALPEVSELHIGHALIGHALFVGLTQAVRDFQAVIARAAAARAA
jgi:pyridoxine 5-phosphate synthase